MWAVPQKWICTGVQPTQQLLQGRVCFVAPRWGCRFWLVWAVLSPACSQGCTRCRGRLCPRKRAWNSAGITRAAHRTLCASHHSSPGDFSQSREELVVFIRSPLPVSSPSCPAGGSSTLQPSSRMPCTSLVARWTTTSAAGRCTDSR